MVKSTKECGFEGIFERQNAGLRAFLSGKNWFLNGFVYGVFCVKTLFALIYQGFSD